MAIKQLTSIDDHAIIEDKVRLVITSCLCQFSQRDFPKLEIHITLSLSIDFKK